VEAEGGQDLRLVLARPEATDAGGQHPVDAAGLPLRRGHAPGVDEGFAALAEDVLDLDHGHDVEHEHGQEDGDEENGEGVVLAAVGEDGEEGPC